MLPTADIVLAVVEPLLEEWREETIWLQMSSVGAAEADRLAEVASAARVTLFDAPVSGSTHSAEEGKLTILASGPDSARAQVEPVFEALGSRVQWVGEAGMGSRLKLAANHWMIAMVAALAEAMHLCQLMGLEGSSSWTCSMADRWAPRTVWRSSARCSVASIRPAFQSVSHSKT